MTTLPSSTPTLITIRHGSEGPHHDPYSYSEVTIERNKHVATLHYGLAEWVDIDGTTMRLPPAKTMSVEDDLANYRGPVNDKLLSTIGMDIATICEAQERYESRPLRCCHKPKLRSTRGYAGECVLYCDNCGTIVAEEDPTSYIL